MVNPALMYILNFVINYFVDSEDTFLLNMVVKRILQKDYKSQKKNNNKKQNKYLIRKHKNNNSFS